LKYVYFTIKLATTTVSFELKVKERTYELEETRRKAILRLGRAAEYCDNETGMHVIRMSRLSAHLAK